MRAAVWRVRALSAAARREFRALRSARATVLRTVGWPSSPPPSAFRRFGPDSCLIPPCHVRGAESVDIGRDVWVLEHSGFDVDPQGAGLVIGDGVRLSRFTTITATVGVVLEDQVAGAHAAAVTDTWGPGAGSAPVHVEQGAYLGAGCVVGPGVRIGAGAYVGEGAVVFDDVEPHTVVFGNPAVPVARAPLA